MRHATDEERTLPSMPPRFFLSTMAGRQFPGSEPICPSCLVLEGFHLGPLLVRLSPREGSLLLQTSQALFERQPLRLQLGVLLSFGAMRRFLFHWSWLNHASTQPDSVRVRRGPNDG